MIRFSEEAEKFIRENRIKQLYIILNYVKGPCSDNLCRMIPKVEIKTESDQNNRMELVYEGIVKVYASPPIAKSIRTHNKEPLISIGRMTRKFKINELVYSF